MKASHYCRALTGMIVAVALCGASRAEEADPPGRRHVLKTEKGETLCSLLVPQGWNLETPAHSGSTYSFRFVPTSGKSPVLSLNVQPSNEPARIFLRRIAESLEPRPLFTLDSQEETTGLDTKRDIVWRCSHEEDELVAKATISGERMIELTLEETWPAQPFVLATLAHIVDSIEFQPRELPAEVEAEASELRPATAAAAAESPREKAEIHEPRFAMRVATGFGLKFKMLLASGIAAVIGGLFFLERRMTHRRHERQIAEVERAIQARRDAAGRDFRSGYTAVEG